MRKLLITIGILLVIFVGMLAYKNVKVKTNNKISATEVTQIQDTISKVYLWKEVTGDALPEFNDINQAKDKWIWEVVKNNLENYEVTYDEINEKAKEIFGKEFTKEFPKEGNSSFSFNQDSRKIRSNRS